MSYFAELLQHKLIPWSRQNPQERFVVARPDMEALHLPITVQVQRRKIRGKRVIVKNLRLYQNTRNIVALWPDAGLNEVNQFKLACVVGGHLDYQLGDYAVQCGAGHFIFMPPGTPHPDGSFSYADASQSGSCEVLFFVLHQSALECWISHWEGPDCKSAGRFLLLHGRATALFRTLVEEVVANEEKSLLIGKDLLAGFLVMLQREVEANHLQPVRTNAPQWLEEAGHTKPTDDFKTRLENYVQANLHKPLTLDLVAREMFLSRTQFIRSVRRETGQSFNQFLTDYRLAEAKQLLQNSQWTVAAIAYFVGFKSPSYFRTIFKQRTGQVPLEYRNDSQREKLSPKRSVS